MNHSVNYIVNKKINSALQQHKFNYLFKILIFWTAFPNKLYTRVFNLKINFKLPKLQG